MICVLDTSAAIEVAFNSGTAAAYKEILASADQVIAPHFFIAEVTNVLWKYVRMGVIDENNAQKTLVLVLQYVDAYIDCGENAVEALHEACRLQHAAYDMFYFTLARRNNAVLLTKDKKLAATALKQGVQVL